MILNKVQRNMHTCKLKTFKSTALECLETKTKLSTQNQFNKSVGKTFQPSRTFIISTDFNISILDKGFCFLCVLFFLHLKTPNLFIF